MNVILSHTKSNSISQAPPIVDGLDFLISHFNDGFPRKISTKATKNVQIKVDNKEEALAWLRAAEYLDCKMNTYPYVKRWKGWQGINRQVPNFLFVDLDLGVVKEIEALDKTLYQTLKKINDKLGLSYSIMVRSWISYIPTSRSVCVRR